MARRITQTIAAHVAGCDYSRLPEREIAAARMSLIDTFGCAFAGHGAPGTASALAVSRGEGAVGRSRIWATGEATAPRQAAFANSVLGAALDYDSVFHEGIVHADIVVVPTAWALAEATACPGRDLLSAVAVGNDVLCRLSLATRGERKGWFFTSVYGVLVAAAMTARLLGLDEKGIANAMGLAVFNAAGTYQSMSEQSMSKRMLAAFAVQSGIHCGYLAAAGFEGVTEPLEGQYGIFEMYQRGDVDAVVEGLGKEFYGSEMGRKPYPSCQCNHAPIEAALSLRRTHRVDAGDISEVMVLLSPHACRVVGGPCDASRMSQTAAQFSVQYSVACALVRGKLGIAEILPSALADAQIAELASRVRVIEDSSNPGTYVPASVFLRMRNGSLLSTEVSTNRGGAGTPLTENEMRNKFADCLLSSSPAMTADAVRRVFDRLMGIGEEAHIASTMGEIDASLRGLHPAARPA